MSETHVRVCLNGLLKYKTVKVVCVSVYVSVIKLDVKKNFQVVGSKFVSFMDMCYMWCVGAVKCSFT